MCWEVRVLGGGGGWGESEGYWGRCAVCYVGGFGVLEWRFWSGCRVGLLGW